MAALCQRVSWHHVSSQFVPVRRDGAGWSAGGKSLGGWGVRARREQESPFTEKASVKRVHGGGQGSGVALKSLELWDAGRAREAQRGVSSDGLQSFTGASAEFRESKDESSGPGYEDDDIAARLPELREVLSLLRTQWAQEEASGSQRKRGPGNVFLVGTGPGNPDLLTVKALKLMQSAELVLYDRLVSTDILDLVHDGARLLYVGKTSGYHSRTQEEIHELLLSFAESGATVVRLKGGDPLVFGRGGEEMDFLQEQGINVQVVPGITAASGIAAELGIPLTHRGAANSVRFLTGHSRKGGDDPLYVAERAADPDSTLVIYMGLATLPGLAAKLMANGLPSDIPAVAVERGTTAQQRVVFAHLNDLPAEVAVAKLESPTLIIVGRVVALSHLWPFKTIAVAGEAEDQSAQLQATATSVKAEKPEDMKREPRVRSLRGPDPILPSQN
ncbi:hypothetical protein KC19_2G062600 [Ceratodon purpureus]|uniref:uroporphyrinogen-III C-methyltransferase n=1 Tax=Ceratodon purpureus TaxID=3225 RepID=A0A8T0ISE1_CERPU|nr:hypothetical protein KC19_2G062600 [Ceratodon purpureus]